MFGAAVIVGNLVYHRVQRWPEEAFDWCMAVHRPVAPITVFGNETLWRAILIPRVVKFVNCRFVPFLELATAIVASFALGP